MKAFELKIGNVTKYGVVERVEREEDDYGDWISAFILDINPALFNRGSWFDFGREEEVGLPTEN